MIRQSYDEIEIRLSIDNTSGNVSRIVLEPWAEEIDVRKGDHIELLASGPADAAQLNQEYKRGVLVLYAHHGWVVTVKVNSSTVITGSSDFPAI